MIIHFLFLSNVHNNFVNRDILKRYNKVILSYPIFSLKDGSKYTYIILEALVRSQRLFHVRAIGIITVLDAILTSRQPREKLQRLYQTVE